MIGSRLSLARKLRGMSQTELAKAIDVTPRAISKYEKEGEGLSPAKLEAIAEALDFTVSFLTGPEIEGPEEAAVSFRARSKMSAKKRDQAMVSSSFGLILSDWMDDEFSLPEPSIPDFAGYDPEDAAGALRMAWGLGEGPISNIIALLEAHGARVFSIAESAQEVDAYSFWDESRNRPFIFLTTLKSGERRRMDAAHELGHLVLHRKIDLTDKDSRSIEKEADEFGSAFLMPSRGFQSTISKSPTLNEIMRVKQQWKVSAFAAVVRSHALGALSDWQYHNLCVIMGKQGMRTKEQNGIIPERSQVADKIFELLRSDCDGISTIVNATGIPGPLILNLTFHAPVGLVKGGARTVGSKAARSTHPCNLRLITTEK